MAIDKKSAEAQVHSIDINGLLGRMVRLPGPKTDSAELLFVYGQPASLEQWLPFIDYLNRFGAVTAVDLPGIGGMTSFYAINERPSIDTYADYLASFLKFKFRRKQLKIIAEGFGFVAVTRMLQRYPALREQVRLLVSIGGVGRFDDLMNYKWHRRSRGLYVVGSWALISSSLRLIYKNRHFLSRQVARNPIIRSIADVTIRAAAASRLESLRRQSDLATHFAILRELAAFDNCSVRLDVPLVHVVMANDRRTDHHRTEGHLRVITSDVVVYPSKLEPAALYDLDAKRSAALIPPKLRSRLRKK